MAWNDWIYENTGADDFMRAARQVQGQGLDALTTGDFWKSAGAGTLEAASWLMPGAGAVKGGMLAYKAGSKVLPAVAKTAFLTTGKGPVLNTLGTAYKTGLPALNIANGFIPEVPTDGTAPLTLQQQADRAKTEGRRQNIEARKRREAQAAQDAIDAEKAKQLQALIDSAGRESYNASVGQAQSEFSVGKKAAQQELRDLMMQLGQRFSGSVLDMSMAAAQAGMDTSPGALDTGIDYLGERRTIDETGGRQQYAQNIAKLTQQLAAQRNQAALARQAAKENAIMQAYLAEKGMLGA